MSRGRPHIYEEEKHRLRVVLALEDYQKLQEIAKLERTDVATLIRRAIALEYLIPRRNEGESHGGQH